MAIQAGLETQNGCNNKFPCLVMLMLPTKTFDKQNTSIDFIFNSYSLRKLIKLVKEEKKKKSPLALL